MLGLKKKKEIDVKQTFFNEQWKEEELIGEGSYGKVYKAKKEEFGIATYSAIKQIQIPQSKAEVNTLKTEGMTQSDITNYYEKSVQKWVEEIKFMSIFKDCENVVNIEDYEIIKKKNEIGWTINIRMELLKNLDSYALENNITDKEILKMAIHVAKALEECEENNVVHRDIKPDNIFVNGKGVYKVGDFGIAKHIEKTVSNMSKKGTENYMAPELYKNEKGNRTVDTYSLGIMLYRYFNYNRLPFLPDYPEEITMESREEALYKRISGEKMKVPQNAPREIAEIILKACNYYPKDRYTSATELREELERVYEKTVKPKTLFNFNEKQMSKLFLENTKSDSHNSTLSILTGTKNEEKAEIEIKAEEDVINQEYIEMQKVEVLREETVKEVEQNIENTNNAIEKEIKQENTHQEQKQDRVKEENKIKSELGIKLKNNKKIIICLLIILFIIGTIVIILKCKPKEEITQIQYVIMPSLVGMQSEVATEELQKIEVIAEYEYIETANEEEIGKILEQSINENEQIEKGTIVKLKVAVSQQKVKVINVVGMTVDEAKTALQIIGLNANITEQYNEEIEQGRVISQMTLEGEEVSVGATVELLVSLGKEVVENQTNEQTQNKNQSSSKPTQTQNAQKPQTTQPSQNEPTTTTTNNNTPKNWSDWVETLPAGVTSANYNIETKTQYSYRDKSTTTSTSNSMEGWTLYDQKTIYGEAKEKIVYSPVQSTNEIEYVLIKEEKVYSQIHYHSYYDGIWHVSGDSDIKNKDTAHKWSSMVTGDSTNRNNTNKSQASNQVGNTILYTMGLVCPDCRKDAWTLHSTSTRYVYEEKTKKGITYYFYKWNDWSAYADTQVNPTDTREVRTRTLYKYQEK